MLGSFAKNNNVRKWLVIFLFDVKIEEMKHNVAQKEMQPPLDDKAYYAALCTHDARFDGQFFVGVISTGVYCRPICRAKLPKEKICRFFNSAAAAEAAGYRQCLKCRPELAPGLAPVDVCARIA